MNGLRVLLILFLNRFKPTYKDLDIPVYNYNKILETNNLGYLRVYSTNKKPIFEYTPKLESIWNSILNLDMKQNGQDEKAVKVLELKKRLLKFQLQYIKGNHIVINEIKLIEKELVDIQKAVVSDNKITFDLVCGHISKNMGFQLDPKKTTLAQYKAYLQVMELEAKEMKKHINKHNG